MSLTLFSWDLKAGAARSLDKLVAAMRRDQATAVTIEGHTDSTGKRAYNVEWSKRRGNAVRSDLTSKGVAAQRIKASGPGLELPGRDRRERSRPPAEPPRRGARPE